MTLLEISNIFNTVTTVHPSFVNYHFGWPSDMDRNVANNYDASQQTGTLYPAVLVTPPDIQLNPNDLGTSFSFRVHFMDLQAYSNDTSLNNSTKVEQWSTLFEYGLQWFREVQNANKNLTRPAHVALNNTSLNGGLMDSAGSQRLIYVYFDFELSTRSTCTNLSITYPDDVTAAGLTWPPSSSSDIENVHG